MYIDDLPDRTVPAVRISSRYSAHLCATRCVLVHIHDIMIYRKDRGFVHIPNCDFKRGSVFEGTEIGKTRIHMCIHPLDVEGVGLLPLVVQRLLGNGTIGENVISTLEQSGCIYFGWMERQEVNANLGLT